MASRAILYTLLISFFVNVVHSRGNIFLGHPNELNLIYRETHDKVSIPLVKRSEDVTITGVKEERIQAIIVQDLRGNGLVNIQKGGLGQKSVTLHLETNVRGEGYKFLVSVYAS